MKVQISILLMFFVWIGVSKESFPQQFKSAIVNPSNPNLDPNWKWYINSGPLDLWYSGAHDVIHINKQVYLPYFTSGSELNTPDVKKDMFPQDGWRLVCKDFGTPSEAPTQPFFMLYNVNSGILRLCFYNAREINYSYFKAELFFVDESQSSAILTFTDDKKPFLTDFNRSKKESFIGKVATYNGWGYADFHLFGYDPSLNKNARIRLQVHGIDKSKVSASGDLTLDQVMEDANLSASDDFSFSDLKDAFQSGAKQYKGAQKVIKGLTDRVDKEEKKIEEGGTAPWWLEAAQNINSVAQFVPYGGAIVGFVKSAFFGNDEVSRKPINFEGDLELSGKIENEKLLISEDFVFNPNAPLSSEYYRFVQDVPIGVFNLIASPILVKLNDGWPEEYGGPRQTGYTLHNPEYPSQKKELNYVLNPDCGLELISMKAAMVYENKSPTAWYEPELLTKITFELEDEYPSGVALKLIFRTKSQTLNTASEKTVFKVYPFGGTQDANEMLSYSLVRVGENLAFSNFFGYQYHVAYNNITINDGFSMNVENSDSYPFYYFIAGNQIKINDETDFLSDKSINFKIADFRDISLKSASILSIDNLVERTLEEYEAEVINQLNFENLRVLTNSDGMVKLKNYSTVIKKDSDLQVKVFPNPAIDIVNFNVESNKGMECNLFLYNELGQNVYQSSEFLQNGKTEIGLDISRINGLNGGSVFFYKVVTSDFSVYSGKILLIN